MGGSRLLKRICVRLLFVAVAAAILWGFVYYPVEIIMPTVYEEELLPTLVSATPAVSEIPAPEGDLSLGGVGEEDPILEGARGDILAMMYHDLSEDTDKVGPWTTTPDTFRQNLLDLMDLGYQPLSVEEYVEGTYSLLQNYFIVTFDDGYLSNLTMAQPILQSLGIRAAVFVITDSTRADNHMSWRQLQEAQATGVLSLYSHTHTHMNAQNVLLDKFLLDARQSQMNLEYYLGEGKYQMLAYPNGGYTRSTMQALHREGWDLLVMQDKPSWYNPKTDGKILVRVNVTGKNPDMLHIINYNRARTGLPLLAPKTEENT